MPCTDVTIVQVVGSRPGFGVVVVKLDENVKPSVQPLAPTVAPV